MGFSRRSFFKRSAALGGAIAGAWAGGKADEVSKAIPEPPKPTAVPESEDIIDYMNDLAQMPMSGYEANQRMYGVGSQYPIAMFASAWYLPPSKGHRSWQEVTEHLRIAANTDAQVKPPKQT